MPAERARFEDRKPGAGGKVVMCCSSLERLIGIVREDVSTTTDYQFNVEVAKLMPHGRIPAGLTDAVIARAHDMRRLLRLSNPDERRPSQQHAAKWA
jgi:hypothetical protein